MGHIRQISPAAFAAGGQFGAVVNNTGLEETIWGTNADSDHDGLPNSPRNPACSCASKCGRRDRTVKDSIPDRPLSVTRAA
jgi:hypothetical protein